MSATLDLACDLIRVPSVTPHDGGCLDLISARLVPLGFVAERLPFGAVDNLWLRRGQVAPLLVFAGHTDVVPPGDEAAWSHDPFDPLLHEGMLYGRGAADMKGSLAAMVTAIEGFVQQHPDHAGSIALLLTSDEEGPARDGTVRVVDTLQQRGEQIDWCVVGEPSSSERLGDVIKNGRRGSLTGVLTIHGKQGHVAYPQLAKNPVHQLTGFLHRLAHHQWDAGNDHFPPTSLQIVDIAAGAGATNVIPGSCRLTFNLRYSTEQHVDTIQQQVASWLQQDKLDYELQWTHSGAPFLTAAGKLVDAAHAAVLSVQGYAPELSTSGGTSDGRFIAPTGAEVVELGPINRTIHQVDECVPAAQLDQLSTVYREMLRRLLVDDG